MAKPWDETMKKLVEASSQEFVNWLTPGGNFLDFLSTELFKPKEEEEPLRADRYLAIELNGEPAIVHLEIQSGPDPRMDERLLEYNYRVRRSDQLRRPVHSCVIYLRPVSDAPQPPMVWPFPTGHETLRFNYGSIELAELEVQFLLNLGFTGLLPLLPLTQGGMKHETVLTMFTKLQEAGRTELIPVGGIFASLAYGEDNVAEQIWLERILQAMYDIVQETPLYQSWTKDAREEGLKEGREEGRIEGKIETLLNIVRARFPRLASVAKTETAKIDDPDILDGLILKVSAAKNAKEARRYLRGEDEEAAE